MKKLTIIINKREFGSFYARNKSVWIRGICFGTATVGKIYLDLNDKKTIYTENKRSGVYRWTNNISGASYIGSSTNLTRRFRDYFSLLFLEKEVLKTQSIIYRALLKYDYFNFTLEILEYCESADTIKREQYYLDLYKPEYNICLIAGSSLGRITSDETRLKLRNAWLIRLHKNNLSDVSLREYTLDTLTEKLETYTSNIAKLFKRFEQIKAAAKSNVTMETRFKILASTKTSQAVIVTDLISGVSTTYLSARRAADALGISNSTVMNKLNNKNTGCVNMHAYKGR